MVCRTAFLCVAFFWVWNVHGQTRTFDLPAGVSEIRIHGYKGQVTVTKVEKAKNSVLKMDGRDLEGAWKPLVRKHENAVEVSFVGPSEKADWKGEIPSIQLDLRGPSVPLVLTWKEGEVRLQGWDKGADVTLLKGKIKTDETKSHLRLTVPEAETEIARHTGRIEVDQLSSALTITKSAGPMVLSNFSGRLRVLDSQGDLQLRGFQGKSQIERFEGSINVESANGEVVLTDCKGSLNGKVEQGALTAQLRGPADVRLRGQSARIQLTVPRVSGARVDLGSNEGQIVLSTSSIPVDRVGDMRVARGRLAGAEEGSIFVRTESGEIRLKTQ